MPVLVPQQAAFFRAGESPQIAGIVERCYRTRSCVIRVRQVRFAVDGPFTDSEAAAMDARVSERHGACIAQLPA